MLTQLPPHPVYPIVIAAEVPPKFSTPPLEEWAEEVFLSLNKIHLKPDSFSNLLLEQITKRLALNPLASQKSASDAVHLVFPVARFATQPNDYG
tara:strand:- start:478 stop:759 length:282 start_codon:yes stop_codon:yes gene_type:complete